MARPQPHFGAKANHFYKNLFSSFQFEYASSKTGVLLQWRHILVNHQENAIVGKKSHTVVVVVVPLIKVHLHINIVTTIRGHMQSSIGVFKAFQHMALGVRTVPSGNY